MSVVDVADALWAAECSGAAIDKPSLTTPLSLTDAYAVQQHNIQRRLDAGARLVGRKIGITSKAVMDWLKVKEPDFGALLDDMLVEGVAAGAEGWVAGLVNALPRESVVLFERARDGGPAAARQLYEWFLPLLRLDVVPEFVQLIKLCQQECGMGSERVRAPRMQLSGAARDAALATIRAALRTRPEVGG